MQLYFWDRHYNKFIDIHALKLKTFKMDYCYLLFVTDVKFISSHLISSHLNSPHLPHLTSFHLTSPTSPHLPHLTSSHLTSPTSPHLISPTSPHLTYLTSPNLTSPQLISHLTLVFINALFWFWLTVLFPKANYSNWAMLLEMVYSVLSFQLNQRALWGSSSICVSWWLS